MSLLFDIMHYFYSHTLHSLLSLVVWIDCLINRGEKSPPQTDAFIEIWSLHSRCLPKNHPKLILKKSLSQNRWPKKTSYHPQWHHVQR